LPGFNDAHAHIWKIGHLLTTMIDLRSTRSMAELQAQLRERASRTLTNGWVVGRGYNEVVLAEARQPTRADLDAAVTDKPVFLTRACGHIAVANSRALAIAGVSKDTPAPSGGVILRDDRGVPTGI